MRLTGSVWLAVALLLGGPVGAFAQKDQAERILNSARVEKLLLIDDRRRLVGMITMRDIDKTHQFPRACKDSRGRLRVGAAVGVRQYERVEALIKKDVDVLVVDTALTHFDKGIGLGRYLIGFGFVYAADSKSHVD